MFARPARNPSGLEEDAAVFGLSADDMDKMSEAHREPEQYELYADTAEVFFLFRNCQGSWRVSPAGGLIGLDKSDAAAVANAMGIKLDAKKMSLLIACETAFIREFNKRQPRRGRRT